MTKTIIRESRRNQKSKTVNSTDCRQANARCPSRKGHAEGGICPITYFRAQVQNCLDYAEAQKKNGAPIVGIMCEYTPRELIMAAGGVPVCLCGGAREMIGPAEKILPSNLCPLIKSTFGFSLENANPFLEMAGLLVAETTCDGKKKMYEILSKRHPMHVLELPQKPDDPDAFNHWVAEIHKLKNTLEKHFKTAITSPKIRSAIRMMNRERKYKRALAAMMKEDHPPLTGRELLDMKSLISCMPSDFAQYERALTMLKGRKLDPPAHSRVRVLLTGVPLPHGAERVIDIIEESGGLVVCQENCTGLKPVRDDVDETAEDPILAIAEKYFHLPCSVMMPNKKRLDHIRTYVEKYRIQCVIELVWHACLTYDIESVSVKQLIKEKLGLPYLKIETDYSPSDSARIAVRVQALFETVKGSRPCCL